MNVLIALTMAANATLLAAPTGTDAVDVKLLRVAESRFVDHAEPTTRKKGEDTTFFSTFGPQNCMTLTLEIKGDAMVHATHFGKVVLTAKDDKGAAIELHDDYSSGLTDLKSAMAQIDRNMMFFAQPDPPADVIKVDVKCTLPSRGAKAVAAMKGVIHVRSGQPKEVVIANAMKMIGKKISNPMIAQAGINIVIADPETAGGFMFSGEPGKSMMITVSGDADGLTELSLIDAQGAEIECSKMWSEMGSNIQYTLMSDKELPKDTGLKLTVSTNSRTINVPFDLTDIALP